MNDVTMNFLYKLSARLSGRSDCKMVEYVVCVYEDPVNKDQSVIVFTPDRLVFPSRYKRKEQNKVGILEYIIKKYFDDILITVFDEGSILIKSNSISNGVYKYTLSVDRRRRKWERLF